jgi:hypothetical protein
MVSKLAELFPVELEHAALTLVYLQTALEKFLKELEIRAYNKEAIIGLYNDINMYLKEVELIFGIILERMEKYGPMDKSVYDIIDKLYDEIYNIDLALWDAMSTYEKNTYQGADDLYNIAREGMKTAKRMWDFLAHELNL